MADAGDLRDEDVLERREIALEFGCAESGRLKCAIDIGRGDLLVGDDGIEAIAEALNVVDRRELAKERAPPSAD